MIPSQCKEVYHVNFVLNFYIEKKQSNIDDIEYIHYKCILFVAPANPSIHYSYYNSTRQLEYCKNSSMSLSTNTIKIFREIVTLSLCQERLCVCKSYTL